MTADDAHIRLSQIAEDIHFKRLTVAEAVRLMGDIVQAVAADARVFARGNELCQSAS